MCIVLRQLSLIPQHNYNLYGVVDKTNIRNGDNDETNTAGHGGELPAVGCSCDKKIVFISDIVGNYIHSSESAYDAVHISSNQDTSNGNHDSAVPYKCMFCRWRNQAGI